MVEKIKDTGSASQQAQPGNKQNANRPAQPGNDIRPQIPDLLAMFHVLLMMAGLFLLLSEVEGPTGSSRILFPAYALTLCIPLMGSFLLVRKIKSLSLYLLLAAGETALAALLGSRLMAGEAIYVSVSIVAAVIVCHTLIWITRVKSRLEQSRIRQDFEAIHEGEDSTMVDVWETDSFLNYPSPWHWVWLTLLYLPGVFASLRVYYRILFILLILDIFVMFGWHYLTAFDDYIRKHHRVASMPVDMMRKVHRTVMAAALLLIFLVLLPAIFYGKEPLDGWRPKVSAPVAQEEVVETENTVEASTENNWMEELDGETKVMPKWVQTLIGLVFYGVSGAIGLWILAGMLRRIREMGRDFGHEEQDEVIFLDQASESQDEILYGGRKKQEGYFTTNARIRRLYKKTIQKGTKDRVADWKSPEELETSASLQEDEKRRILHETYEKARYSKEGCEKEDLDRLKK